MADAYVSRRRRRNADADSRPCEVAVFEALEPRLLLATAGVTTPVGTQSGVVPITYALTDAESDACSILVEYSPNGGTDWYGATAGSGGDGTTGLTSSPTGVSHSYVWNSTSDLGSVLNSTVQIRLTPTDVGGPGAAAPTGTFTVDNSEIPSVFMTTPSGTQSGTVTITYTLKDTESDACSILVEYSDDGGANWHTATKGSGGDSTTELTSSPGGTAHTYHWNSTTDLGTVLNSNVQIRVTPTDAEDGTGKPDATSSFTVDNVVHPSVSVTTPSGTQSEDVTITYSLTDAESDTCSIVVEYSDDGGGNWYAATEGTGGDGTTGLTSSPGGASHTYAWDSTTDLGAVLNSSVQVRITATDAGGTGEADATSNFTVNNRTDPSAVVTTPTGTQSGDVTINYTLVDAESDACSIVVQYSDDAGETWHTATPTAADDDDGTTGLTASPGGTAHTFVWDSTTNLGLVMNDEVQIRITPSDPTGAGVLGDSGDFTVNNLPTADILWRNTIHGMNVLWFMEAGNVSAGQVLPTAPASWRVVGTGDFNGDGQTDLLWRNSAVGYNGVWLLNDGNVLDAQYIPMVNTPGTYVACVGDFSGDGKADILWRNAVYGGANRVWYMNGVDVVYDDWLPTVPGLTWQTYAGDYDNDGTSDILWREQAGGTNAVWLMSGGTVAQSRLLLPLADAHWWVAGIGDFDGNGDADILWRHSTVGANAVWLMDDGNLLGGSWQPTLADMGWRVAGIGDFNADGNSDILWRHWGSGGNAIWSMEAGGVTGAWLITAVTSTTWRVAAVGEMGTMAAPVAKSVPVTQTEPAAVAKYTRNADAPGEDTASVASVTVVLLTQQDSTQAGTGQSATSDSHASGKDSQADTDVGLNQNLSSELDVQLDPLT